MNSFDENTPKKMDERPRGGDRPMDRQPKPTQKHIFPDEPAPKAQ